jgi:hypothetical protein
MEPDYQYIFFLSLFLSFLVWPLLPTHCRCRGLLFHLITLNDIYTLGRTPLDEGSARRSYLYVTTHQHSQETDIHAPRGIRTRNPSKRTVADPRLMPHGQWVLPRFSLFYFNILICFRLSVTWCNLSLLSLCVSFVVRYRVYSIFSYVPMLSL